MTPFFLCIADSNPYSCIPSDYGSYQAQHVKNAFMGNIANKSFGTRFLFFFLPHIIYTYGLFLFLEQKAAISVKY